MKVKLTIYLSSTLNFKIQGYQIIKFKYLIIIISVTGSPVTDSPVTGTIRFLEKFGDLPFMVENYHKNFEKVLKKNFTNIFVLTILEKEPSHGYKIGNEIEKRTLGMWTPSASTLYWILNNLREKDFIRLIKEDKNKKIYQITDTGKEALKLMKLTQRRIRKSYRRFLSTSIVNNGSVDEEELEHFDNVPSIQMLPTAMRPDKFNGDLTLSERLNLLENQRASIIENRDRMNDYIKDFDETILKIKKELDNEEKKSQTGKIRKNGKK